MERKFNIGDMVKCYGDLASIVGRIVKYGGKSDINGDACWLYDVEWPNRMGYVSAVGSYYEFELYEVSYNDFLDKMRDRLG